MLHVLILFFPWQGAGEAASKPEMQPADMLEVALTDVSLPVQEIAPEPEAPPADGGDFRLDVNGRISADYEDLLIVRITNMWEYPETAIDAGHDGEVSVFFVIARSGQLKDIRIRASSGYEDLDFAAMMAIQESSPFGPFPVDMPEESIAMTAYMKYRLD